MILVIHICKMLVLKCRIILKLAISSVYHVLHPDNVWMKDFVNYVFDANVNQFFSSNAHLTYYLSCRDDKDVKKSLEEP